MPEVLVSTQVVEVSLDLDFEQGLTEPAPIDAVVEYDFGIKGAKVFATCNEIIRLSKPLQSRFRKLFLPRYTDAQFFDGEGTA